MTITMGPGTEIWRALETACHGAGREVVPTAAEDGEASNLTATLCAAIQHALAGGEVSAGGALPPPMILRGLSSTRQRFLEAAEAAHWWHDTAGVLDVLAAIERVSTAATRQVEHDLDTWSRDELISLLLEVVHDIRSPLGSIVFLAERLRDARSGPVNDLQVRQLGLMYGAALGLGGMATDLMDFVKGGRGLLAEKRGFSMAQCVASVHAMIRPMAEEKGLTLDMDVPPLDTRLGYPEALQRVLLNLLTNAVKFTPNGSVALRIQPKADGRVSFHVADSGRGVPDRVKAVLFEPFRWREDAGRFVFSSAGLGLRICRQLVHGMGSDLHLTTGETVGTTWTFDLALPATQG
jgi:signal transduction histidine kinase